MAQAFLASGFRCWFFLVIRTYPHDKRLPYNIYLRRSGMQGAPDANATPGDHAPVFFKPLASKRTARFEATFATSWADLEAPER